MITNAVNLCRTRQRKRCRLVVATDLMIIRLQQYEQHVLNVYSELFSLNAEPYVRSLLIFIRINTIMKINDVTNFPQTYLATVRVVLRDSSMTARTTITADTVQQAKLMLTRIYGVSNVLNITLTMNEDEEVTEATKTLSPQELQVKALADKAEDYKQQAKAMKARQQMAKAQKNLMKANGGPSAS